MDAGVVGWAGANDGSPFVLKKSANIIPQPAPYIMTGGLEGCCGCGCYDTFLVIFKKSNCAVAVVLCQNINDGYLRPGTGSKRWPIAVGGHLHLQSIFWGPFGAAWPAIEFEVNVYDWRLEYEDATYFALAYGTTFDRSDFKCTSGFTSPLASIPSGLLRGCTRPAFLGSQQFAFNP